jgi:hypothetical protein
MGILRTLVLLIFTAFLNGCAAHIPVFETQDDVPATTAQPDHTPTARVTDANKPKPPAPKPATTASTTPQVKINSTAPNVGSPQKREKERAEEERKEQHLKQVIEGICRNC